MSYQSGYRLVVIGSDGEPVFDAGGNPVASTDIIELPMGRWGRRLVKEYHDIVHETELGRRWVLARFERQTYELPFRIQPADLEIFRQLDDDVGGMRDPFLYCDNIDVSPTTWVFVRKEPSFDEGQEQPVNVGGQVVRLVDYVLRLTEEPAGLSVTA